MGTAGAQLPGTIDLNVTPGTESSPVLRVYADEPGDQLDSENSNGIAFGDVNGDGFDDMIIGATQGNTVTRNHSGEVYVVYGNTSLPASTLDFNTDGAISSANETRILGEKALEWAGWSVAAGDVNGDGFDDVIIGAWHADPIGGPHAGEVYVVYGSASSPGTTVKLGGAPGSNGETRILGDDAVDLAGWSVASGDVNSDGFDDVILGAKAADPSGRANAGEVYVIYGSASLPGTTVDLNNSPGSNGETRILGDNAVDLTGWSVASGDMNGDGFDDVIIGAYGADPLGRVDAGEVYIVYGSASLPGTTVNLNSSPGSNGETRILGEQMSDNAGVSVGVGDVNGDGFGDVIVGALSGDPAGGTNAGKVYVVYGHTSLPGTTVDLQTVSGDVRVLGDNTSDNFGYVVRVGGDLDSDGFSDFAAWAFRGDNPSIGGDNNSGYAVAVFGDGDATAATVVAMFRPGAAPRRGMGGRLSPVARTWLSFDAGDNGSGGASTATVTLTRSDAGITNLGDGSLSDVADAYWQIATGRTGFSDAEVTFQYLDSEISGMTEANLRLYQAPALSGPWTQVPTQSFSTVKNTVTATMTTESSFFAIRAIP